MDETRHGPLQEVLGPWLRSLGAQNKSLQTITTYRAAVSQLDNWLLTNAPTVTCVDQVGRVEVEGFIVDLLASRSAAMANNRYR